MADFDPSTVSASPSSSVGSPPSLLPNADYSNGIPAFAAGQTQINDLTAASGSNVLPWVRSQVNSSFFHYIDIEAERWNQLFPYRLLVIDTLNNNRPVGNGGAVNNANNNGVVALVKGAQQGTSTLSFTPFANSWVFNLPIGPQQLSITDQYAINTSATLRGVLEEHNGVKFKIINASGTMGVWSSRPSVTNPPQSPNVLQSVFGGTISAATDLATQVQRTVNTFTTNSPNSKPTNFDPATTFPGLGSTGYYQAMLLTQFLEQYAEAKKDPANSSWRLVFDIPKQNTSYVVTPMSYTWQQSVQKTMEIMYQMQFKAWRRIVLDQAVTINPANAYTITPGILQRILNGITEARLTMSSAIGVIGAVTSDVNNVFSILSQTALFVKDALGVVVAASDLPSSIVKDYNSAIQNFVFQNSSTVSAALKTSAGAAAVGAIVAASKQRNGISQSAASSGQLGNNIANSQQTGAAANIFNNSNAYVDLLDQVPTNKLVLNTAQQNKLNSILNNTTLTVQQLKNNASAIQALAIQLEDYFGAGSDLYSQIYNITPPQSRTQPMSIPEFLILDTLYDFIQSVNILTATTQVTENNIIASLDYIAGLANQSEIPFNIPTSKVIVPVPYGATIEAIAARYLGDPQRWLEIATLNKLEEPYIDESGFQLPLLSNAIGRQVIVANNDNLYLGQTVLLRSTTQIQQARKIDSITQLPNGNGYILTLNGAPDLGVFTLSSNAYVQAYLPNTVNSQQKIYIPSDLSPAQLQGQVNIPLPSVVTLSGDPLAQISGVDWLLDETGDIVIDAYGNFSLSYGMTNIIQALRILFTTQINSFLLEPEYGLGISPGTSISDLNIQQLYKQINAQIQSDPRFAGVSSLQILANPPKLTISLGIQVQGQTGIFPVAFELAA